VSGKRILRVAGLVLAAAGGALLLAAGPAMAATGSTDIAHAPGDLSPLSDLTPAGVPVLGLGQSVIGATKALPGTNTAGY
jgi:hypothetical protein